MKTPKPADIKINLAPKDPFFQSIMGRTLKWALSAGRYIVIFTELVVIVSFAARFSLDRTLTDLNSEIVKQQVVIESYGDLEKEFRIAQEKTAQYQQLEQQRNLTESFANLSAVTPQDIVLKELIITQEGVVASGTTLSQASFNLLINNLQLSPDFFDVTVNKVEANEEDNPGFIFSLQAKTNEGVTIRSGNTQTQEDANILDRTGGL